MEPIRFKEVNLIIAENQKEYLDLPAHVVETEDENVIVTSCWAISLRERLKIFFKGKIYVQIMTFRKPLQPIKISTEKPILQKEV